MLSHTPLPTGCMLALTASCRRANFQPERTNTILGPDCRLLHGEPWAWARLGGVDVCFGPGSFMQVC